MAASKWLLHDAFIEYLHDYTINLEGDTLKMRLYTSASGIHDASVIDATTESANEISGTNGYTTGGTPVIVTISRNVGTTTVECTDGSWLAAGGSITARYAAIINETVAPDAVLFTTLLDDTNQDVQALDTNTFLVQIDPNGIYTAAQAP